MAAECATGCQQEEELLDRSRVACACFSSQIQDADLATKVVVELRSRQILSASPLHALRHVKSTASSSRARAVKYVVRLKSSQPTHWRGRRMMAALASSVKRGRQMLALDW